MNATVAICAYSLLRWELFVDAVRSVVAQLREGDDCLIVIDHNEEFDRRASAEFASHPSIRIINNAAEPGISGARNTAVAEGRGEIIAFLDDDAVAGPDWMNRVRAVLSEQGVIGVGTAAVPAWPDGRRPDWFPPEFDWVVGCTYRGLPTKAAAVRNVIGAAMAFRREAFSAVGGFSSVVGRVGAAPTGCEETEFCIRLLQARPSDRIMFLPEVSVDHRVTLERTRLRYFLTRCAGEGRSKARVSRLVGAGDGLSSERRYVASVLPRAFVRELGRGLHGRLAGWQAAALIVTGVAVTGGAYLAARLLPHRSPDPRPVAAS